MDANIMPVLFWEGGCFMTFRTLNCFYFEKARKDETNPPWALGKYCMKGLPLCIPVEIKAEVEIIG